MAITDEAPRQGLLATITEKKLLNLLDESTEPLSRSEVARLSGISKPAISDAARRLEESGVIVPTGMREGRRGGVATLYGINPDRGHSVALAVDSSAVSARAIRLDGSVGAEASLPLTREMEPASVIRAANRVLGVIERQCRTPWLAAAVSVADPVDPATGEVIEVVDSVFPAGHFDPVRGLDLGAAEITVDNDVNWAALAEHHVGSMRLVDDFVYAYLGTGLGAGLFLGGRLQRGARGLAGEIGHLHHGDGRANDEDLTRSLVRLGWGDPAAGYGLDVELARGALTSPAPTSATRQALDALAVALANMVTLLNSSAVVLGGPLGTLPPLVDHLSRALPELTLDGVDVVVGQCSPLDGAAFEAHRMAKAGLGF
jgi:predicted NBD/HSP70 family sugar kinase/biotin operon repressor